MRSYTFLVLLLSGVLLCTPDFVIAQEVDEATPPGLTIHVVQRGENLMQIASQYAVTVQDLAQLNGLYDVNSIQVGQRLLVPGADSPGREPTTTHIVQPGETLLSIAQLYDVDVDTLVEKNNISNANQIYSGQVLNIYSSVESRLPFIPTGPDNGLETLPVEFYTVQPGETLYQIALQHNTTVQEIASANSLVDQTQLLAGTQLVIPTLSDAGSLITLAEPINNVVVKPHFFVEGETGSVVIETNESVVIEGLFLGRELQVIQETSSRHIMLIPIPIYTQPDVYPIQFLITRADGSETQFAFNIRVVQGIYETQNLDMSPEMEELLAPAVQQNELTILQRITGTISTEKNFSGPFGLPAAAALNGQFGTRRAYNNGPVESFHSGADFASAPDTAIFASAPGRVVLADEMNIRGNTIVIDHGWGVYTLYAHLNLIRVSIGQTVATGDTIGYAGASGRVTGPHLHWEVWVNGIPVNPVPWTQKIFP